MLDLIFLLGDHFHKSFTSCNAPLQSCHTIYFLFVMNIRLLFLHKHSWTSTCDTKTEHFRQCMTPFKLFMITFKQPSRTLSPINVFWTSAIHLFLSISIKWKITWQHDTCVSCFCYAWLISVVTQVCIQIEFIYYCPFSSTTELCQKCDTRKHWYLMISLHKRALHHIQILKGSKLLIKQKLS